MFFQHFPTRNHPKTSPTRHFPQNTRHLAGTGQEPRHGSQQDQHPRVPRHDDDSGDDEPGMTLTCQICSPESYVGCKLKKPRVVEKPQAIGRHWEFVRLIFRFFFNGDGEFDQLKWNDLILLQAT